MSIAPGLPSYCTNVVAGRTLSQTRANLARVFGRVRTLVAADGQLPIGLWLSARAAQQLQEDPGGACGLRDWLLERGLVVVTLNAFPYHDFHGAVVKHRVYEPDWTDARRLLYTTLLVELLPALLPAGCSRASISTLPLGWRPRFTMQAQGASMGLASAHLQQLVRHLARVEEATGLQIQVDLEPEPGCVLDRARDAIDFLSAALPQRRGEPDPRRYVGICHDICHAAVMFESQRDTLRAYRDAGIRVGKVQISSAVTADGSAESLAALANFVEARYLHQTCVQAPDSTVQFFEDLPLALTQQPKGHWRTHFHVPLFAAHLGALGTTQGAIDDCLTELATWPAAERPHLEVETYAWEVLPPIAQGGTAPGIGPSEDDAQAERLAAAIARELGWAQEHIRDAGLASVGAGADVAADAGAANNATGVTNA